eukprot:1205414-Prymnesium_polylepis.3
MEEDHIRLHADRAQITNRALECLPEARLELQGKQPAARRCALDGVKARRWLAVVVMVPFGEDGEPQLVERCAAACQRR